MFRNRVLIRANRRRNAVRPARGTRALALLTTREIADAFYVPEATMAQRISRAKRTLRGRCLEQPGDLAVVLREAQAVAGVVVSLLSSA